MPQQRSSRQWPADMPGVTTAWLASANGVSERTIRWRRSRYKTPADELPAIDLEIGLSMARLRAKGAHLCLWTRLAIVEWVSAGATYRQVAEEFGVSVATVGRAVRRGGRGYDPLACTRTLSSSQTKNLKISPPVAVGDS
jgi:hypothetical protein